MKTLKALILLSGLLSLFISCRSFAQCAVGVGPTYSSGCTSQYFTSITAGGTGVASTISYSGGSCIGTFFNYFATQGVTAPTGSTVNINVSRLASYYAYLAVYVDWNNDGIYETTELVGSVITMPVGTGSAVYSFTIPLIGIVTNTNLHMRVFLGEPPSAGGSLATISPPCSAKWGESCDYYINATCTTPTISVSPVSPSVCGPTGSVLVTASGAGATPYYQWSSASGLSATSGTSITATPGATATYTVTGYGPGVCPAAHSFTVTVNPAVTPVITPGGSTTICNGSSITLSETSGTGTSYQWYKGATLITGATNSSYIASPIATTTYSVSVTSAAGCTGSAAITITVAANPAPVITPGGPTTFCSGGSVTLSETSGTGTAYQWYNGAALIAGATNSSYVAAPAVTTTYSVLVTNAAGCTGSATITVTIFPSPSPVITPGGPTTICSGSSITLTETSGTGTLYQWYNGASVIAGATNNAYIATPATTTTYSVSVTNAAGCTKTTGIVITVLASPTPVITPGGPTTFCAGNSITLTETSGTGSSYQWYNGAALIAGATNNSYVASPAVTTTYSVLVTSSGGCNGSASVTITVLPKPVPVITAGGPVTFCAGGSVTLSETSGTGTIYQWYNGAALIAGATNSSYIASPVANTTYSVSVTNASGCTGYASIAITVLATPVAVITPAGSTTVCSPATVLLNANFSAGYTYVWLNSGGIIAGATTQSYTASVTDAYKVVITSAGGCIDTSAAVNVTINPQPVAMATASGPLTFCANDSVVLTAAATAGYTYQWLDGTTPIPGATNVSYTATVVGTHNYRLVVTNGFGCSDTTASGLFTVVVNPIPVSSITASGPLSFCAGGSVTLSVPSVTGYIYQWFSGPTAAGAAPITGATSASYTATLTGYYYVLIASPAGCVSGGPGSAVLVTDLALPYIIPSSALDFCWGGHVVLSLGISSSAPGITFQWMLNGVAIPGAVLNTYSAMYAGVYTCVVNVSGGCISTTPPVTVVVNPLPNPVITYVGGYLETGTFYTSYQWYRNLTPIPGATYYRIIPVNTADYGVIVTDSNGCISDAVTYPLDSLYGNAMIVNQLPENSIPVIYPNPATNMLYVRYSKNVAIVISSVDGRTILESPLAKEIDITSLPCGTYMITLYDENHNRLLVDKLIKQ